MEKINIEEKSIELDELMKRAEENALDSEEFMATRKRLEFLTSQKDRTNFLSEIWDLKKKMAKSSVTVKTLYELKMLLEKSKMDKETQISVLAHENAHGNKADSLGAKHESYILSVWKIGDKFGYSVGTHITHPDAWDKDKDKNVSIEYTKAPEEYGGYLSDKDKEDIEQKNNTKN